MTKEDITMSSKAYQVRHGIRAAFAAFAVSCVVGMATKVLMTAPRNDAYCKQTLHAVGWIATGPHAQ